MLESKQILAYDDPSKTFLGVRFILHGFDSVKEDKVRSKLLEGGGIDAVNYGPDCNHVIVDNIVYDDPICVAARRDGKTLVTGLWVDHSFDVGMPVDPSSVMYRPMRDLNGLPGAKSLVMCLTGYQRQDRDDIMTMVALMGANFSKPLVANKVTHLICYKFEGEKYELAKKIKKIKLVNHHWLEDCLKAWELLPEADYAKSGYELELEAEAKDSEEETEDLASTDLRKKSVISPQNTRVESKSSRQSPVLQDVSRDSLYLTASESLANVGDASKNQSAPRKEIDYGKASLSRGTHDTNLDNSTSSCARSPGKKSSEVPPLMLDGTMISEKVDHVLASASRSAKKSPDVDVSKLSSKSRKFSLSLSSERVENYSGSPSAPNVSKPGLSGSFDMSVERHQDGIDSNGVETPLKGTLLNLDEGQRKITVSRGSSRSPLSSHFTKRLIGSGLATKAMELPVSGSSIDGSHQLGGDISSANVTSHLRSPANITSHLREEVNDDIDKPSARHQDRIDSDRVKTPLKGTLLHLDEVSLPSKRNTTVSRGSSRSPISSHYPKTLMGSGLAMKRMELPVSGPSIDGSHGLEGDISPTNIASLLREEASLAPKEASDISTASGDRQGCNDQALQCSREESQKRTLSNLAAKHISLGGTNSCPGGAEMQQSDPQSIGLQSPGTGSGLEKMDGQADLNLSKVDHSGTQMKLLKKKMLAKKTLGSRPTICKGNTTKHKGSLNLQMQKEHKSYPNGAVAMEDTDNATITEKVVVVSPTTDEDGPVDDETRALDDKGQNAFDMGTNKENSDKVGAPSSGKSVTHTKKQPHGKTLQMKEKGAKPVGVKNSNEVEMSGQSKKSELPESKSTGDDGEKKLIKGKKRLLTKSKPNKLKETIEKLENDGSKHKEDEKKTVSDNEEMAVLAGRTNKRPTKKLKNSADVEKENIPATNRQQCVSNDIGATGKATSQPIKKPLNNGFKAEKTNTEKLELESEPACFILSGHKLQRKEFQQVIRRLKGRVCRDSHNWSYQATHFIVPDPVRRTEKFFAAAASGSWILKTDYLTASNEAGRFLSEEPYEWHKKCLTEDGAINLEAPRKWRLLRERTGHGAFYGMRIVIYGECIAPPLDTLKRVVKAGDGTILATSPPYTRFLRSGIDFAIVSPGMPRVDMWIQEFLRHEVPCVVADYLVEYVCKPGYSLERYVQYNTHAWAQKSLENLVNRVEEVVDDPKTPEDQCTDDVACKVCGSHDRGEEMLICGDESGSHGCGVGIHIDCLDPPLEAVPEEDWFCQDCGQKRETKIISHSSKKRASKSKK